MLQANIFKLVIAILATITENSATNERRHDQHRLQLDGEEIIKFGASPVPQAGLYNPHFWVENNERSTSRDYKWWNESDVYLIEWPGNITKRDPNFPLLKWTHNRAKYMESICVQNLASVEMRAYAYGYLYLTWGHYRLTSTFTPPLTIPATTLKGRQGRTEVPVSDFGFVQDALIIAAPNDHAVIIVSNLQMTYSPSFQEQPYQPLKFSLAQGIESEVDSIVTQLCCRKSNLPTCPFGDLVVAYKEASADFKIHVSWNGGLNFRIIRPQIKTRTLTLFSVLAYPETRKLVLLYGNRTMAALGSYSIINGLKINDPEIFNRKFPIRGRVRAKRVQQEMSLVLWDKCNVWYSLAEGRNLTKAIFYVNGIIHDKNYTAQKHYILSKFCKLGRHTVLATSPGGKLAILDEENNFHWGADTKSETFQLVALKKDLSLILKKHTLSVVPHFDLSDHPKLLYPPRYLEVPHKNLLGKNYSQRLGMRLLPRTVFPSEYITAFYEENAHLKERHQKFALKPCQTSSISVNRSISQKPKKYSLTQSTVLNFTVTFKSRSNDTNQLMFEPSFARKFLRIRMKINSIGEEGIDDWRRYWFTYQVVIAPRIISKKMTKVVLNFFTIQDLRCNILPRYPVHINIEENSEAPNNNEEMWSVKSYLKLENQVDDYGRKYEIGSCKSCGISDEEETMEKACYQQYSPTQEVTTIKSSFLSWLFPFMK